MSVPPFSPVATCIASGRDHAAAWVGTADGAVFLLQMGQSVVFRTFADPTSCVTPLDDHSCFIAGSDAGQVSVRRCRDGEVLDAFTCTQGVKQAAILGDRRYLTLDHGGQCQLWSASSDGVVQAQTIMNADQSPAVCSAFGAAPESQHLALIQGMDLSEADLTNGVIVSTHELVYTDYLANIDGLVGLSKDGRHCFIYWDNYQLFDAANATRIAKAPARFTAWSASLSDHGRLLAVGTPDGEVLVIDANGQPAAAVRPTQEAVYRIDINPAGTLAGWIDEPGQCGLVDATSGREILTAQATQDLLRFARPVAQP